MMDLTSLVRSLKEISPEVIEALSAETLRALATVPPEVLRALKDVPAEVIESLSPELLAALPGVSPNQLQALRNVSSEVIESLSPELLRALASVQPEVLLALREVPAEVLEALRPELLEALVSVPAEHRSPSPRQPVEPGPHHEIMNTLHNGLKESLDAAVASGLSLVGHFGASAGDGQSWICARGDGAFNKLLSNPEYRVAQVLSVLGSEVRLSILRALLGEPRSAAELVTALRLGTTGQAYHHLRELESAGYIEQREGRYQFVGNMKRVYLTALALAADAGAEAPDEAGI